jgi:ubiquinone/menaquinone biosynthesis C-methylase UbiE
MSFYEDHLLPRCIDWVCGAPVFDGERASTAAGLAGRVLELGFGSGTNLPFYPAAVSEVLAVDPSALAWRLSARRRAAFAGRITPVALLGQRIDLPDASVEAALCTFTLCTVPDVQASLAELRRVLRPGGSLHVLEHGRAPDPSVARLQGALEPLWSPATGGCHLTRDAAHELGRAGFELGALAQQYAPRLPRAFAYLTRAVART